MVRLISPFNNKHPLIHPDAFIDLSARIIGAVIIEERVSIWPMVVRRADSESICIKKGSAVLDLSLVEAPAKYPVTIEEETLISHRVVIHGAHIQKRVLIGIGAIVLDGSVVSTGSIVGAGALVAPGTTIPPNSLVMGMPGKVVRETTEKERYFISQQVHELFNKSRQYRTKEGRTTKNTLP